MESIGGQAVIEGVMIRNKNKIATAVRTKKGIVTKVDDFVSLTEKYRTLKLPFLRGSIVFFETMKIGINTLNYSADLAMADEKENAAEKSEFGFYMTLLLAVAIAIFIFLFLPIFITTKLFNIEKTALSFNIVTGIIRIIVFLLYVYAISYMKDAKRLYMYHGAEHKVVNCYEAIGKVTLKTTKKYTTIHKRCGTSFLFIVFITAMLGFALIDMIAFAVLGKTSMLIRLFTHLLFLPAILGISYEVMKYAAAKSNVFTNIVTYPGSLIQKITTQEPTDDMIKVAMAALKKIV